MRSLKAGILLKSRRRDATEDPKVSVRVKGAKQIKQGPVLVLDEDDDLEDGDFHHVE